MQAFFAKMAKFVLTCFFLIALLAKNTSCQELELGLFWKMDIIKETKDSLPLAKLKHTFKQTKSIIATTKEAEARSISTFLKTNEGKKMIVQRMAELVRENEKNGKKGLKIYIEKNFLPIYKKWKREQRTASMSLQ